MSAEPVSLKAERRSRALQDRDDALRAAFYNEQLTRSRVDALEAWQKQWSGMTLRKRLTWLLLGR